MAWHVLINTDNYLWKVHHYHYIITFWHSGAKCLTRLACQSRFSSQLSRQWTTLPAGCFLLSALCELKDFGHEFEDREKRNGVLFQKVILTIWNMWNYDQVESWHMRKNTQWIIITLESLGQTSALLLITETSGDNFLAQILRGKHVFIHPTQKQHLSPFFSFIFKMCQNTQKDD